MKPLRITAWSLAWTLAVAAPALASLASDAFKDVPPGHWAEEGVAEVAIKRDLMKGYPDGTFKGDQPLTRAQFADSLMTLLRELEEHSRASWRPLEHPLNNFADVAGPEREGILTVANDYALFEGVPGITANAFGSETTVTRFEMAKVINNLMRLAEAKDMVRPRGKVGEATTFKDVPEQEWAYPDLMEVSQRYRVMVGFPDGTFRGSEELTRYQYAQAISQTVPMIRALITQTIDLKQEERRAAEGPWRFQEKEPLHVELSNGVTGVPTGASINGKALGALAGRYVAYPNDWFILSDTRLQFGSGTLADLSGGKANGLSLDESAGAMLKLPLLGSVQLQPYLGARAYLDVESQAYAFIGPAIGLVGYWRPVSSPWGFYAKGGASYLFPGGTGLLNTELGAEYHLQAHLGATIGFNYWEAPTGYLSATPAYGRANHTGLTLGILYGF